MSRGCGDYMKPAFCYRVTRFWVCALVIGIAGLGCKSRPTKPAPGYFGPTEPMAAVIAQINANNVRVASLWAHLSSYEINFTDDQGKRQSVVGDSGTLQMRKPRDLRVNGNKPPNIHVFNIGSNRDFFWLVSEAGETAWWGRERNSGKPCVKDVPIRPDLLIEVLGVSDIESDFTREPMPVMTFNNDGDAYIFTWVYRSSGPPARLIAMKEVWYDRKTKLPKWVKLFDENGRVVVRAWLQQHVPVVVEGVAEDQRPKIASDYRLFFPDTQATFNVQLADIALHHDNFPNDRSFAFDPANLKVEKKIQVDESCGP